MFGVLEVILRDDRVRGQSFGTGQGQMAFIVSLRLLSVPRLGFPTTAAGPAHRRKLTCKFRSEPVVGQPQIEDDKVRSGTPSERERLGNDAGDTADLVTVLDKDLFQS